MQLTEEQIAEYSKNWNVRVKRNVAERFLRELDTEKMDYFGALQKIHRLDVSVETLVALEHIIKKLYNPVEPKPGRYGVWPKIWIGTDNYLRKQLGIYEEGT